MDKNEPDFSSLYQQLFFNDKIPPQAKIVINEFSNSHQNCLIPNMHFIGMVFKVIMSLKDYMKLRP